MIFGGVQPVPSAVVRDRNAGRRVIEAIRRSAWIMQEAVAVSPQKVLHVSDCERVFARKHRPDGGRAPQKPIDC